MSWISEPIDGIANVNLNLVKKSSSLCPFFGLLKIRGFLCGQVDFCRIGMRGL